MIEVVNLTPMQHILLSTAGTKEQEMEEGASSQPGRAWQEHRCGHTVPYFCRDCACFSGCPTVHGASQIISWMRWMTLDLTRRICPQAMACRCHCKK